MGYGGVFFDIVHDQVMILPGEKIPAERQRPKYFNEEFHLQGVIQQVMFQAESPERQRAGLHVIVNVHLFPSPNPGRLEPGRDLFNGEAHEGRFVKVIQNLGENPVAIDGQTIEKIPFFNQRPDDMRHVILGGFQGQKLRRPIRLRHAGLIADRGPKKLQHPPCQAAKGDGGRQTARQVEVIPENILIGFRKGALGHKEEDLVRGNARFEQLFQP